MGVGLFFSPVNLAVPPSGGPDDAPAINRALATGRPVALEAGVYTTITPIVLPTGATLTATAGTTINATIPTGDGHTDSPFYCAENMTSTTTLSATVVEGATTCAVVSAAGLPVGGYVALYRNGAVALSYEQVGIGITGTADVTASILYNQSGSGLDGLSLILSVAGASAQTLTFAYNGNALTKAAMLAAILAKWPALHLCVQGGATGVALVLTAAALTIGAGTANTALGISSTLNTIETDIPVGFPFVSGDEVNTCVPTFCAHVDFGGATLNSLGGGRALWLPLNWDCLYENLISNVNGLAIFGPDFDLAGRRSVFRRIVSNYVSGAAMSGILIEAGQDQTLDLCRSVGKWALGFQVSGYGHTVRNCSAQGATGAGLSLQYSGATDIFASRYLHVVGGSFDGCSTGVQIVGNSIGNQITGVSANYNTNTGFTIATGSNTAITTGASRNTLTACGANLCNSGFLIGDAVTSPCDSNSLVGCTATYSAQAGFYAYGLATNTLFSGCTAENNTGDGYKVNVTATGTQITGCKSTGNAGSGVFALGDVVITGFLSVNDVGPGAIYSSGSGSTAPKVRVTGARLESNAVVGGEWNGIYHASTATFSATDVDIVMSNTGSKVAVYSTTAGEMWLEGVRCYASGGATSYGLYTMSTSVVHIGPGCVFDGLTTPITLTAGALITMVQTGGVASVAGGAGTTTMTFAQHYCNSIEVGNGSAIATGTQTLNALAAFVGQAFDVRNYNTIGSTTIVFGITITASTTARIRCNATGTWEHEILT